MATIEVKNDYMLGRQNERLLYDKCMELEIKINKAIEYIKKYGTESEKEINYVKYNNKEYCICASDFNEGAELILEILGDKESTTYTYKLTKDENGTIQINGEWYRVDKE